MYKHLCKWNLIYYSPCHNKICIWTFSLFPQLQKPWWSGCFCFLNLKQYMTPNFTDQTSGTCVNTRYPCVVAVLHHQHLLLAHKQKWCFMKTPPANSSLDIFLFFFFLLFFFVFHKQVAKGHFHLVISHIRKTSKHSFANSVYLHRYEFGSFIEWYAQKSYYPHAAQLTYSQLLQIDDVGSNIHVLNQYSGHSVCLYEVWSLLVLAYRPNQKQPLWCQ